MKKTLYNLKLTETIILLSTLNFCSYHPQMVFYYYLIGVVFSITVETLLSEQLTHGQISIPDTSSELYYNRTFTMRKILFPNKFKIKCFRSICKNIYIYSPSLHQDLHQELIRFLNSFTPNLLPGYPAFGKFRSFRWKNSYSRKLCKIRNRDRNR